MRDPATWWGAALLSVAVACAGASEDDGGPGRPSGTGTGGSSGGTLAGTSNDDDAAADDDDASGAGSASDDAPSGESGDGTTGCTEQSFFLDADGDGHGDPLAEVVGCVAPADHVPTGDDCDDDNPTVAPSNIEVCDGQDNDCDTMIDEPPATMDCQACTVTVNGTSAYYFCPDPLTYDAARTACMAFGGDLLKVDDQAELDFLGAAEIPASAGVGGYRNGLSDLATEGTFVWTDGSAPTVTPWNAGEPNDANAVEDCVEMTAGATGWNDIDCAEPRAFVCEVG